MSKKSPTSLSMEYLNNMGFCCCVVEKWIPGANVRKDAFEFGDILAYNPSKKIVALVQASSWNNFGAREKKILESAHLRGWLKAGGQVYLLCWGPKGLRKRDFVLLARGEQSEGEKS